MNTSEHTTAPVSTDIMSVDTGVDEVKRVKGKTKGKPKKKRRKDDLLCKGQQFRLYPTVEQAALLRQWIGCGRFVWNWALNQQNNYSSAQNASITQNANNELGPNSCEPHEQNSSAPEQQNTLEQSLPKTLTVTMLSNQLTQLVKQHVAQHALGKEKDISSPTTADTTATAVEHPDMAFLRSCPRTVLTNAFQHLGTAWSNYFDGRSGKRLDEPGKPVFRKRLGKNERATFQVDPRHKHPVDMDNQTVSIPGLGPVTVVLTEPLVGDLSSITVRRKGRIWLVSFSVINVQHDDVKRNAHKFVVYPDNPTDTTLNPNKEGVAALDMSVVSGAVATTDGTTTFSLFNQNVLRSNEKHERRKAKYQRAYSRKMERHYLSNGIKRDANGAWPKNASVLLAKKDIKKNTRNMEILQEKIAVLDLHEVFRKTDAIHKFTTKLVQENHTIVVEPLMLYAMAQALNKGFRRRMHEACMGQIIEQLKYKCAWYNRTLIFVDQWFPSSKRCSNPACHEKNKHLLLKDREWICTACNTHHIRDNTAAFNLWQEGWRLLEEFFKKNNSDCLAAGSVVRGGQGVVFSASKLVKSKTKRSKTPESLENSASPLAVSG